VPKVGMEKLRRRQLIEATIKIVGEHGYADTTISKIASEAGLSVGIISHYFGGKDELLQATMWHLMCDLQQQMVARRSRCDQPLERINATVEVIFSAEQSDVYVVNAWLSFWAQVPFSEALFRLQKVYERRLLSNLRYDLSQLYDRRTSLETASTLAVLIDGYWLRSVLAAVDPSPAIAKDLLAKALP